MLGFWLGLTLFGGSLGLLGYTATQNADIKATIEKFKAKKAVKEQKAKEKALSVKQQNKNKENNQ